MEKKYVLEVQLTPQIHEGNMAFYWHIDQVTEDGRYTVQDGWGSHLYEATYYAQKKASEMKLI